MGIILLRLIALFIILMIHSYIMYFLFYRHWVQADIFDGTIKLKKENLTTKKED